jgi:hypothetical protein
MRTVLGTSILLIIVTALGCASNFDEEAYSRSKYSDWQTLQTVGGGNR